MKNVYHCHSFTTVLHRVGCVRKKIVGTALPLVGGIKMTARALPNLYVNLKVKMVGTALPKLWNSLEQSGPSPTQKARKMRKQRKQKWRRTTTQSASTQNTDSNKKHGSGTLELLTLTACHRFFKDIIFLRWFFFVFVFHFISFFTIFEEEMCAGQLCSVVRADRDSAQK